MKKKGFSRNTLVSVKALLSGAFKYAVTPCQYLDHSPMTYVTLPKVYDAKQTITQDGAVRGSNAHIYIEKDWVDKILMRFPEGHSGHIPLLLGYKLGTRLGESYALTVEDFDFKNKTVRINKQVQWKPANQRWYLKGPKYNSVRTISMDDELAEVIKRKIHQIKKDKIYLGELYTQLYVNDNGEINDAKEGTPVHLINVREDGSYISPRTMHHCSQIIHRQMDYKEFDYHSLRHTHATDLAKAGANPKFVQARLGHKSVKITLEIYQHLDNVMEQQGADILNKIYG